MIHTVVIEWRYTYQSARNQYDTRRTAFRKFVREVWVGWTR